MSAALIADMRAEARLRADRATAFAQEGNAAQAMRQRLASNALYKAARDCEAADTAVKNERDEVLMKAGQPCNIAIMDTGDLVAGPFPNWEAAQAQMHHHDYMGAPLEIVAAPFEGDA